MEGYENWRSGSCLTDNNSRIGSNESSHAISPNKYWHAFNNPVLLFKGEQVEKRIYGSWEDFRQPKMIINQRALEPHLVKLGANSLVNKNEKIIPEYHTSWSSNVANEKHNLLKRKADHDDRHVDNNKVDLDLNLTLNLMRSRSEDHEEEEEVESNLSLSLFRSSKRDKLNGKFESSSCYLDLNLPITN